MGEGCGGKTWASLRTSAQNLVQTAASVECECVSQGRDFGNQKKLYRGEDDYYKKHF